MQQLIEFIFEFIERLFSKNPAFFKKLMWFCGGLSTCIILALTLNSNFAWGWGLILIFKIPLTYLLANISTLLAGMALMAKLPNPHPNSEENK